MLGIVLRDILIINSHYFKIILNQAILEMISDIILYSNNIFNKLTFYCLKF